MKLLTLTILFAAAALAQTPAAPVAAKATPSAVAPAPAKEAPKIPDNLMTPYLKAGLVVADKQAKLQAAVMALPQYSELKKAQDEQTATIGPMQPVCGADFMLAMGPDSITPICAPKPIPPAASVQQ